MTTLGGYAIVICLFLITPIVLIRRWRRITPAGVWLVGVPLFALSYFLGWVIGPPLFWLPLDCFTHTLSRMPAPWPPLLATTFWFLVWHFEELARSSQAVRLLFLLPDAFIFASLACLCVFLAKRRELREKEARHQQVQTAIRKITADGKVEGPKGPYVPHKKWNIGFGTGTPRHGSPDKQTGYYTSEKQD